jgi:hypothetical protein
VAAQLRPGDRVEYLGSGVFDNLIVRGEIGEVVRVDGDWVSAGWPRSGLDRVPMANVGSCPLDNETAP